jgi:hypothetical protein
VLPAAFHDTEVYENNPLETDQGRLKGRLRPMRGLVGPRNQDPERNEGSHPFGSRACPPRYFPLCEAQCYPIPFYQAPV